MRGSSVLTNNSRLINSSASMINNSATSSLIAENDDAREKISQKDAAKLSNLNKSSCCVSSPSFGRRQQLRTSFMSNGLTHEQLREIYSSCIRLSSENKINIKNAFGLQLIDYMQDLLTTNAGDDSTTCGATTNFQVAGCTLDASVKIYSYRVDSVHSDAVKIAGTLGSEQPPSTNEDDSTTHSDDSIHQGDGDSNKCRSKKSKNKKSKRHTTRNLLSKLEKNLKNINLEQFFATTEKDETNYEGDNVNVFTFGHADSNPITSLLVNNFGPSSDRGDVVIDPSSCIFSNSKDRLWNQANCVCDPNSLRDVLVELYQDDGQQFKLFDNIVGIVDNFKFLHWRKPDDYLQPNSCSILDNINVLTGIVGNEMDRSAIEKHRKTLLQSVLIDTIHSMDETLKHDQSGIASDHGDTTGIGGDGQQQATTADDNIYYDEGGEYFPQQTNDVRIQFPNKSHADEAPNGNNNNPDLSVATELTNMVSNVPMNMTGGLTLELSTEPGEYSYFKNLNSVKNNISQVPNMWAGPEHWKHISGSIARGGGESTLLNKRGSVVSGNANTIKARQPRKRKQLDENVRYGAAALGMLSEGVDFSEPLSAGAQKSLKTGKASSTFSKNILVSTNAAVITLLETDRVDIKPLFELFLMPNIKLSPTFTEKNNEVNAPDVTLPHDQIYDYDNDNDRMNYCSGMVDDVSDHKSFNDDYFSHYAPGFASPFKPSRPSIFQTDKTIAGGGIFTGAATPMPLTGCISQKNRIEYARFAKRFNTRQIKSTLWNILKPDAPIVNDENSLLLQQCADEPTPDSSDKTSFDKVYNSLIDQLPEKSAQNVSVPIAIVCLLHLANEKNLSLEGNELMDNIHIKVNGKGDV